MTEIKKEENDCKDENIIEVEEVKVTGDDNEGSSEILEDEQKLEDVEVEDIEEKSTSLEKELKEMKFGRAKLKDENFKLQNELDAIKERLLRTSAEYENYRNRTVKEKEGIYSDACIDVLKNVLPALDNMERAVAIDGSVEDIKKGIEMTLRQFKDSLGKLGVEEIDASGEFDPNLHDAIVHVEDEAYGENTIVEVLQKGYKKQDKVIRYSMVRVAN
ncbi:nucleotide exchange factor GrpE [Clostridium akagii]|uniref:nucleotide exchange factor GrpE n=1 Tax=Clostridium akagii TaxID=91623 RepID=UPI00047CEDFD|nr:nucleotide exchange factor GrpE [Clostridium akagii]